MSAGLGWLSSPGEDDRRRRIVTLASLAPAKVVFPEIEDGERVGVTGFETSVRNQHIVVHHTGEPNAHLNTTTNYCEAGYDFFIRADGEIVVCPRWSDRVGAHAKGCNCLTTGIMLTGCFGGCASGNVEGPTDNQECSLAHLVVQLGTPIEHARLVPHRHCHTWNPCQSGDPTPTVCCGENLTSNDTATHWNAAGDAFVNRVIQKCRNVKRGGCCFDHCPSPLAAAGSPERDRVALDAWSEGDLVFALYPTADGPGWVAEVGRAGHLIERRAFALTPDGAVAAPVPGLKESDAQAGDQSKSARGSITAWSVVTIGALALALVAGALAVSRSSRPGAAGEQVEAAGSVAAKTSPWGPSCAPPAFYPARLPWTDRVGEPDKTTKGGDGTAQLTWTAPQPGSSAFAPREVNLVRRPHPDELSTESATGTARGHATRAVLVGDEGVGGVRMFWREAERDCESYELNIDRGITLREALSLLPR
jgi:hypothetical protein